jgi:hypothetical protein
MLLMKAALKGGIAIGEADLAAMLLPALFAALMGCLIVLIGRFTLAKLPGVRTEDGIATAGLFGAVSGSTLAAGMVVLDGSGIAYEPWASALYPFMDIPALVLATVLASLFLKRKYVSGEKVNIWGIVKESQQGSALSALLLGLHGLDADRAWPDRFRAWAHSACGSRLQPRRRNTARGHRRFQFRLLRPTDAARRHTDRQPFRLHRLINEYRHTSGHRDWHTALHWARRDRVLIRREIPAHKAPGGSRAMANRSQ